MEKKTDVLLLAMFFGVMAFCLVARAAAGREPQAGMNIGNVSFSAPITAEDAAYLGLSGQTPFTLRDIKSPYVVIESMHTT
jgi:hypothetical protein|uniref:Uncharacterized protein n=1 Tax=Desulfobacca acetoxidans TaxID=60893 RepID=A0A7V6A5J4_9BACT